MTHKRTVPMHAILQEAVYSSCMVSTEYLPATIANLIRNDSFKLIIEGIKKNGVQFRYGTDRDKITFMSRPHYYAIHITRQAAAVTKTHEGCSTVRDIIESAIKTVTSCMNYAFTVNYQLAFECPVTKNLDRGKNWTGGPVFSMKKVDRCCSDFCFPGLHVSLHI